ncbi:HAD hydrolase-like protein [Bradyrhizobium sp. Arg816]|uniref:HAD hydrolase-like protein n=1 Tax=Bradyrhizobium sp. Arg816 TaxID=2998491 RepID=UPI00249EDB39|nr:HAD hydrolase-like protein [Bradyrhizobium sp. Arg816]MDI3561352.1 HAD hydrolase-like protein [Bradyrhizobium sp. Arg816]
MPISLRGVIFDFDGPIFDGRDASQKALARTFDRFEASTGRPDISANTLPLYGPNALIALAYADIPAATANLADICDFYRETLKAGERQGKVVSGIQLLLQDLKARDIKCAILSSRATAELVELVTHLGLHGFMDEIWGKDAPLGQKPDPAAVRALAGKLSVAPNELVYVGDSDRDFDVTAGTGVTYYHAAWTGEPSSRAYTGCRALLRNVADLEAVLRDTPASQLASHRNMPSTLKGAIRVDRLVFYAGAGVSVQSGIGGWDDHYFPILQQLKMSLWAGQTTYSLPQLLQLVAAESARAQDVYDRFKQSFMQRKQKRPNAYHYAMMRSGASRIWTTNYDQLFEAALASGNFPHSVVRDDGTLMENFANSHLIVKMNGDFEHAKYAIDLEWDLVFLEEQFDLAERHRREIWRLFEDDYRSSAIVFVGTSFTDPALRRLLSSAAKAVPRTRFWHHLLVKAAEHPADRIVEAMYVENMKRMRIETHLFKEYSDIERWVRQIAVIAIRPIVGFSGTAKQEKGVLVPDGVLDGGTIKTSDIEALCLRMGRALVQRDFRVTSGHGPGVGVPVVEAAFEGNANAARFYLRRRGSTQFSRTAPAVVVSDEGAGRADADFGRMRERFISELDILVAMGGSSRDGGPSGTEIEINMALERSIPVVILKQAGGIAAQCKAKMMANLGVTYSDPKVASLVRKVNEELDAVGPAALPAHVDNILVNQIEDLIAVSIGSEGRRAGDDDGVANQRRW